MLDKEQAKKRYEELKKQTKYYSKMYYEEVKRIDINHLNNICKAFDCEISELLEYVPDKK